MSVENNEIVINKSVTVGTTATLISPRLDIQRRKLITITNTSTSGQTVYIHVDQQPVSTGTGIPLFPNGSWSEALDSAYIPTTNEIWAIATSSGSTLAIQDRLFK